jgi:AraC-like DNA-binding protein
MTFRASTIDTIGEAYGPLTSQHRHVEFGPIVFGNVTSFHDWAVECDDVGSTYFVHLPISGRFKSQHRGAPMTASRTSAPLYVPGGGPFRVQWEAGSRSFCVGLAPGAVDAALVRLLGDQAPARVTFEPVMHTADGMGRAWTDLVLLLSRQLDDPDSLLTQPLVAEPLMESVMNGFLLSSPHSHSAVLAAPVKAARPSAVRMAIDLIEAEPQAPLTVERLAAHCHVGVRTLQKGFREHLGMSPMAYVRTVRLDRAYKELRAADPSTETVGAVARRSGFRHLGRFSAVFEARYGQAPGVVLRSSAGISRLSRSRRPHGTPDQ